MLNRFTLATKITVLSCLAMLTLAASLVFTTQWALDQDLQKRATDRQETNMTVARDVLGANGIMYEYPVARHLCNLESV